MSLFLLFLALWFFLGVRGRPFEMSGANTNSKNDGKNVQTRSCEIKQPSQKPHPLDIETGKKSVGKTLPSVREDDAISRQGKGKEKSGKGKKGGKKGKESHSGKGHGETTTEHSGFEGECRKRGKYGRKVADCWYKQPHKPQGKGKGTGKSKSKVTEISESDSSKQGEETWTPNTSAPQPSLSQVNTIGCADGDSGYSRWKTARNVGTR